MTKYSGNGGNLLGKGPGAQTRFGEAGLRSLGRFLTEKRKAAGYSLRRLSELSGVSVASIRSLEAGSTSPALTTVLNVVDVLGGTIDEAIAQASLEEKRVIVTRSADTHKARMTGGSEGLTNAELDVKILHLEPDSVTPAPGAFMSAASFCIVVEGSAIASVDDSQRVKLRSGDAYHAEPGKVVAWANPADRPAKLICVTETLGYAAESAK